MSDYRDIWKSFLWRGLVGAVVLAVGWRIVGAASGGLAAVGQLLVAMAFFLAVAVIMAPAIARLLAEPSGNLFWPGKHNERPEPMYGIPMTQRAKGNYEEAMAGFKAIARDYPGEVRPYIEMIHIAVVNLKDTERASRIYQAGSAALMKDEDKRVLAGMYKAILSRMYTKMSN